MLTTDNRRYAADEGCFIVRKSDQKIMGEDTWVYTFDSSQKDGSVPQPNGEGGFYISASCNIINLPTEDRLLNDIVLFSCTRCYLKNVSYTTLSHCDRINMITGYEAELSEQHDIIYINNKKVLTEE